MDRASSFLLRPVLNAILLATALVAGIALGWDWLQAMALCLLLAGFLGMVPSGTMLRVSLAAMALVPVIGLLQPQDKPDDLAMLGTAALLSACLAGAQEKRGSEE